MPVTGCRLVDDGRGVHLGLAGPLRRPSRRCGRLGPCPPGDGRGDHQLVVLDEVTYPINWEWIAIGDVVAAIAGRPPRVNIVCTGRDAPQALIDVADTVTEMGEVKHAYRAGIRAKKGIDF